MKSEVRSQKAEARQLKGAQPPRTRLLPSAFKLQTCLLLLLLLFVASIVIRTSALAQTQDAARPSFSEWLTGVRTDALARGIKPEIVDEAFGGLEEPLPVVLERDRSQAETVLSLETYLSRALMPKTIRAGREIVSRHRALLKEVSDRYGVPPRIIAGIWGMESSFGRFPGTRPIVAAFATLAWDPRRSTFLDRKSVV